MPGVKGNSGGKKGRSGRKPKAQEDELKALMDAAWPQSERKKVVAKMNREAQAGNVKAATLLMNYGFGKPVDRKEISGPEGEPLMQPVADAILKVYGDGGKNS